MIEDGEPGEGERFLPLESNGKAVDLDLVNNIMREPYADRFRLILNDLGAGLAARGDDLAEIIDRSDPALRETNAVLAILADQNRQLAELARNGDAVLEPLARDRDQIGGFINSATVTAQATAERGAELEQNLGAAAADAARGALDDDRAEAVHRRGQRRPSPSSPRPPRRRPGRPRRSGRSPTRPRPRCSRSATPPRRASRRWSAPTR